MKPAKRGSGAGAVVADPRVWSAVAIAGLAIASEAMNKVRNITSIRITRFERQIDAGTTHKFHADAFDDGGKAMPGPNITFSSDDSNIVEVVDSNGVVKAKNPGTTTITAMMDGKMDLVTVKVN
jgi:uncharacterized protein YjdB